MPFLSSAQNKKWNMSIPVIQSHRIDFHELIESIITYEKQYCGAYTENRTYILSHEPIDSAALISIKSEDLRTIVSLYKNFPDFFGVYIYNSHLLFIPVPLQDVFYKSDEKVELDIRNDKSSTKNDQFIFDDSQTKWTFLLKDNTFTLKEMKGQCKEPRRSIHGEYQLYDIDIIEEPVDDLPIDK